MIYSGDMKVDIAWHVRDLSYIGLSLCPLSYSLDACEEEKEESASLVK